jgi:hypothetical protein
MRWRNIARCSYTTGCLPPAPRAPSPGTLAFDAATRGESDRSVVGWDVHGVPAAAAGGVLSRFTNDRFNFRRRRVVAFVFGSSWQS